MSKAKEYLKSRGITTEFSSIEVFENAMEEFAKIQCKEQKKLCINQLEDAQFHGSYIDVVKEAPEPKFD